MKPWKALSNNLFIKAIALFLAIVAWAVISSELKKEMQKNSPPSPVVLPSYGKMMSKKLFVKPVFIGQPPEGYELVLDQVKADPQALVIAGPSLIFDGLEKIETEPIDLSKIKKTIVYEANIKPIAPSVDTSRLTVNVTIPIRKAEKAEPAQAQPQESKE